MIYLASEIPFKKAGGKALAERNSCMVGREIAA